MDLKYTNDNPKIIEITPKFRKLVKDFNLETKNNIVLLNKNNSEKIEKAISNDEDYIPFAKYLYEKFAVNKQDFMKNETSLTIVLREIDRDNSTNVWRYKTQRKGFKKIIEYIINPEKHFFDDIKNGVEKIPDILTEISEGLKSFSSKVCKYLCEYIYNDNDKYYINDTYVRHVLPFYLDYYEVEFPQKVNKKAKNISAEFDKLKYAELFDVLTALKNKADPQNMLTKQDLDHILWYCYKSFRT